MDSQRVVSGAAESWLSTWFVRDPVTARSLLRWRNESAQALDEIEAAHVAVGGTGRGRRYATQQINQAYVVLLSSRFQAFCRDLHSETVAELIRAARLPFR